MARGRDPVLQLHDKYFGTYWKGMDSDDRIWRLKLIRRRPDEDLFLQGPKDIAFYILEYQEELDKVEDRLEELTGIPPFPISVHPDDYSADFDEDDWEEKQYDEIVEAVRKHYSIWIRETLDALDTRSPFKKLPLELQGIILEFAVEDVEDWEFPGSGTESETESEMVLSIEVRRMSFVELCEPSAKDRVWNLVRLAVLLFKRWKQLRSALVARYEVNEDTEKEWKLIQTACEPLY